MTAQATDWPSLFDGGVPLELPLNLERLARIPGKRGVFLLEGEGCSPVLLATAANIRSRMAFKLADPEEAVPNRDASRLGPRPTRRADLREISRRLWWKFADSHFEADWRFLGLARRIYPDRYLKLLKLQPPWFIRVDLDEPIPWPQRTRELAGTGGRYFGPFSDGRSAGQYIETLQDAFDLCRHEAILRKAPAGTACVYAQMSRCRAFCDGRASLDEYRRALAEAVDFLGGRHEPARHAMKAQMAELAAAKLYERAAILKSRLARLAELEKPEYRHVRPAEDFRFLFIQRGPGTRKLKCFFVDRGAMAEPTLVALPPAEAALAELLAAAAAFFAAPRELGLVEREQAALVAHYLFGNPERLGLVMPWSPALTPAALAARIEEAIVR